MSSSVPAPAPAPAAHSQQALGPREAARFARAHVAERVAPNETWYCPEGVLAGLHLTADIEEVQKADMTRKMSTRPTNPNFNPSAAASGSSGGGSVRDARPLDPPPVVRVRLWETDASGLRLREVDLTPDGPLRLASPGLVCHAMLFPYNLDYDNGTSDSPVHPGPSPLMPERASHPQLASESAYPPPTLAHRPLRPPPESASMNHLLDGSRIEHAHIVPAFNPAHDPDEAQFAIYFVFDDLKVAERGHFMLRYDLYYVDITAPLQKHPMLGSCFGGVFAVYPSKKCPSLRESTPLFLHLHELKVVRHPRPSPVGSGRGRSGGPGGGAGGGSGRGRGRGRRRGTAHSQSQLQHHQPHIHTHPHPHPPLHIADDEMPDAGQGHDRDRYEDSVRSSSPTSHGSPATLPPASPEIAHRLQASTSYGVHRLPYDPVRDT